MDASIDQSLPILFFFFSKISAFEGFFLSSSVGTYSVGISGKLNAG